MSIDPNAIDGHLARGLKPVYLVAGDEDLLVFEATQKIRQQALAKGYDEREVLYVNDKFKWDEFTSASSNFSLFGGKKLIELRMPNGFSGRAGQTRQTATSTAVKEAIALLTAYCASPAEDTILLISASNLGTGFQNSALVKAVDKVGCAVIVWPVRREHLGAWIEARLRAREMRIEREALLMMVERLEGNLLAVAQEIDKLGILSKKGQLIDAALVDEAIGVSSRFDRYSLIDAALAGHSARVCRMLHGLQAEKFEPLEILNPLALELRKLCAMGEQVAQGMRVDQVIRENFVWKNRIPLINRALHRDRLFLWPKLLAECFEIDKMCKGVIKDRVWLRLEMLFLAIAGIAPLEEVKKRG